MWHVLAVRNCNWKPDDSEIYGSGYRRRRDTTPVDTVETALDNIDKTFSLNLDDLYMQFLLAHKVSDIFQMKLGNATEPNENVAQSKEERIEARLDERYMKQTQVYFIDYALQNFIKHTKALYISQRMVICRIEHESLFPNQRIHEKYYMSLLISNENCQ